jgi:hypothetical protein
MGWDWVVVYTLLGLLSFYALFVADSFLKRHREQQAKKLVLYQKLGIVVQDYLRAREYTEKGRMGEAGKIYENVLLSTMVEILEEIHGKSGNN